MRRSTIYLTGWRTMTSNDQIIWRDTQGQFAIGFIVRQLETRLLRATSEVQRQAAWQEFDDEYLLRRADYSAWRYQEAPAFAQLGKKPELAPRSTNQFTVGATIDQLPSRIERSLPPPEQFSGLSATEQFGLIGVILDDFHQAGRREKQTSYPGADDLRIRLLTHAGERLHRELLAASPQNAVLALGILGHAFPPSPIEPRPTCLRENYVEFVVKAIRCLDSEFPISGRVPGLPRIRLQSYWEQDQSGCRFIPSNFEDQLYIIADSLSSVTDALFQLSISSEMYTADQLEAQLALRARLLIAIAMLWREHRITFISELLKYTPKSAILRCPRSTSLGLNCANG